MKNEKATQQRAPSTAPAGDLVRTLDACRYLVPLKEGGSLPAVVDTISAGGQPAGLFVVKFRGAGQGVKALVAELLVGTLAQHMGLKVPELAIVDLAQEFGEAERDPEIQDILRGSRGSNVGLQYLEGALNFDAASVEEQEPEFASRLVWFDALTFQIDRTARNPNLLLHPTALATASAHRDRAASEPWLIDHGAALYPQHDWASMTTERALDPFPFIKDHVLLPYASLIEELDAELATQALQGLERVVQNLPDSLLQYVQEEDGSASDIRQRYLNFLSARLAGKSGDRPFAREAHNAHQALRGVPQGRGR